MKFAIKLSGVLMRGLNALVKSLYAVACVTSCFMMLLVAGNVVTRYFFNKPILGSVELIEMMMIIIAFFVMPYTTIRGEHVRIDLVTSHLSKRAQTILGRIAFFLSAAIFGLISYQSTLSAVFYVNHPERATTVLSIPFAPFRIVIAVGSLLVCLTMLRFVFKPQLSEEGIKQN